MQYLPNIELYWPSHPPNEAGSSHIVSGVMLHSLPGQALLQVEDVPEPVVAGFVAPSPHIPQDFLQNLSK